MEASVAAVEPFAVGSGDQDAWKPPLRMIQGSQQHAHVRQIKLVRRRVRQLVTQRVHACNRGFVGHGEAISLISFQITSLQVSIRSLPYSRSQRGKMRAERGRKLVG